MRSGKRTVSFFTIFIISFFSFGIFGSELLEKGEEAFLNNQPEAAVSFLEPLLQEGSSDSRLYLYLGIAMQQLGRYQRAVEVFSTGVENTLPPYDSLYFNMGNNYFLQGQDMSAERAFTKAISENPDLSGAILNRANTRMRLEEYVKAIGDYRLYLIKEADSPQREAIEELINRVQAYIAEQEQLKAEEDARRVAEAERQRLLLQSVLSSLENADNDTVNMRADSEDIETFDMELDIEE